MERESEREQMIDGSRVDHGIEKNRARGNMGAGETERERERETRRLLWCASTRRGGVLGSRPKKMYGERLGDGVEYHLMKPTPRR